MAVESPGTQQLRWMTGNPLYGPGCLTSTDGVYRIERVDSHALVAPGVWVKTRPAWKLFIGGVFHDEYPLRREAKAAAQAYDDTHPWDRTGHR